MIEEVRVGKRTLALSSMRKVPAAKDYDSIAQTLLSNAQRDDGIAPIVVENPGKWNTLYQPLDAPRGFINFGDGVADSENVITLLKDANLSTFVHESAHLFFELRAHLATQAGASDTLKNDVDTLLKWGGIDSLEQWHAMSRDEQRNLHEQVARGFEYYLMEGKAPIPELKGVFSRMRSWMVQVYQSLKDLNVNLNDDVRQVFDRMVATDEALQAAKDELASVRKVSGAKNAKDILPSVLLNARDDTRDTTIIVDNPIKANYLYQSDSNNTFQGETSRNADINRLVYGDFQQDFDFGEKHTQFKHDAKGAIKQLMEDKDGEAIAALYHKDIGDIDLVWGEEGTGKSDGFGLAKLVKYHPEVLDNLQGVLNSLKVKTKSKNRIILEDENHRSAISLNWKGADKKWLLSAYELDGAKEAIFPQGVASDGLTQTLPSNTQSIDNENDKIKSAPRGFINRLVYGDFQQETKDYGINESSSSLFDLTGSEVIGVNDDGLPEFQ